MKQKENNAFISEMVAKCPKCKKYQLIILPETHASSSAQIVLQRKARITFLWLISIISTHLYVTFNLEHFFLWVNIGNQYLNSEAYLKWSTVTMDLSKQARNLLVLRKYSNITSLLNYSQSNSFAKKIVGIYKNGINYDLATISYRVTSLSTNFFFQLNC